MIDVKNLTKKYGPNTAVDDISFHIEAGKIYGFLGPNGAGKSTTMNIITGCLAATSGSVTINGYDIFENPLEAKRLIGYLPEQPPLYTDMTPNEYLMFVAEAKGISYEQTFRQVRSVMTVTGIIDVKDRLISNLSKGYKQRVGIAQAMLGNPEIIILDEPTVGLDPKQIIEIRELIKHLGEVKTVILSSHILAEISAVCDHVIIIHKGKLVADDDIDVLEGKLDTTETLHLTVRGNEEKILAALDKIEGISEISKFPESTENVLMLELKTDKSDKIKENIFFAMSKIGCPILKMNNIVMTLEDIFLQLTDDTTGLTASDDGDENTENDNVEEAENESEDNEQPDTEKTESDYKPMFSFARKDDDDDDTNASEKKNKEDDK